MLYQEINLKEGRVVESNFDDFPLPGIAEMPKVEVVLASTGGFWGGHGEPGILPLTPAVPDHVLTTPAGVILRIVWLPESPT